jgi:hypothetical protein
MKMNYFLILMVLSGLTSCKPLSSVTRHTAERESPSEITFATFSAMKQTDQSCLIELIDIQHNSGTIKNNPKTAFLNPVEVFLEDSAHNTLTRFRMEHPLVENFEYPDDRGRLERMIRTRDTARFFLRFNSSPSMEYIRFHSENPSLPVINSTVRLQP